MQKILNEISKRGIVPVLVLNDAEKAVPVAEALLRGGLDCAEITFRTAAAEDSIRKICNTYPDMLVGAGTVLSIEQVDKAVAAGARFIVTPGYNSTVVNYCCEKNIPIIPGCMDTNAIEMALETGLNTVKFFPAEQAGGVKMVKALSGPYVNLHFVPTGGINKDNMLEYLNFSKISAIGGSWMVKSDLIVKERYDEIERLTKEAIAKMLNFRIVHIGINNDDESTAESQAERFETLFGFKRSPKTSSIFASDEIEVCKKRFPGVHGHLAVGTGNCERAMFYLSKKGMTFDMDTAKYKGERVSSIYLTEQIGGFAIHLVEK